MRLIHLQLERYRNIAQLELRPDEGLTVIAGENGQGKTNLLESIYLLTGGKSFRGAKDVELVGHGSSLARVNGLAETGGRESTIELLVEGPEGSRRGRYAKVNGVDYGRATAIAGVFTAVVFEPNHLSLIKAGPEGRRRFVDAALCQLYPGYIAILRRYNRALTQKNALLRLYYETRDAAGMLDAFDIELAVSGSEITSRRHAYFARMGRDAEQFYRELAHDAEQMQLRFLPCVPLQGAGQEQTVPSGPQQGQAVADALETEPIGISGGLDQDRLMEDSGGAASANALAQSMAALLAKSRETDIRAGFSTKGPHREDFEVLLSAPGGDAEAPVEEVDKEAQGLVGAVSARVYGSQGQQRSAVLALKLAEAAVARQVTGQHPVLLLDDVLSELDERRQAYLLEKMSGKQSFVTTCDPSAFSRTAGKVVWVQGGRLLEQKP